MLSCFISILLIIYMFVISIIDIKYQRVELKKLLLLAFLSIALFVSKLSFGNIREVITSSILSLLVSTFIFFLSLITKGGIGKGDAFIFAIFAFVFEWYENIFVFGSGLIIACVFGMVILAYKKINCEEKKQVFLPFIPFIMPAICYLIFQKYEYTKCLFKNLL